MFKLIDLILEHEDLLLIAAVIVPTIISAWIIKRRMKGKMKYFTRREVKDEQLVSISAWMDAYDENDERHTGHKRESSNEQVE